MRERILIAPGIDGVELFKNLAAHGVNTFNLRILSGGELARCALMRSGKGVEEEFLNSNEESAIVAEAMKGVSYFEASTYSDILQVSAAVKRMRGLIYEENEEEVLSSILRKGLFKEKNEALYQVYTNYMKILKKRKQLDSASLIRVALKEAGEMDADFYVIDEVTISPLLKALVKRVSGNKAKEIHFSELFGVSGEKVSLDVIRNCYGAPNEVETILTDIYKMQNGDQCTVVLTDTRTYSQLFYDYALLYDLPITFGCGIPITNSNPAKLLVLYYSWLTDGFFSAYALKYMLNSTCFDRKILREQFSDLDETFSMNSFYDILGKIRFTNQAEHNHARVKSFRDAVAEELAIYTEESDKAHKDAAFKMSCCPLLEIMADELALEPEVFVKKYSKIRKGYKTSVDEMVMNLDIVSNEAIYETLKIMRSSGVKQTMEDIIKNALNVNVCVQKSEPGKIHITDMKGAFSCIRKNMYIMGLSASNYPGSPKENYLLLDADLELFDKERTKDLTSEGRINLKKKQLMSLAKLSSALSSNIYLSYSGQDVSELKMENASSMVYELYREDTGSNPTIKEMEKVVKKIAYFEPGISATRFVGKAYNEDCVIGFDFGMLPEDYNVESSLEKEYAPSALHEFFSCPRAFWFKYILGIKEPEENKPFESFSAMDKGTLAHALMERLGNSNMSAKEFHELSEEYFDRFMKENPPLVMEDLVGEKDAFLLMMDRAFEEDPHRRVVLSEEDIHAVYPNGVKLHGFPDRVEMLEDGTVCIVDYKTGENPVHKENDPITCFQVLVYAYLMEQKGYRVSRGEFRYIRIGETITCQYDDRAKIGLETMMGVFKKKMESGNFTCNISAEEDSPCRFCKYQSICK